MNFEIVNGVEAGLTLNMHIVFYFKKLKEECLCLKYILICYIFLIFASRKQMTMPTALNRINILWFSIAIDYSSAYMHPFHLIRMA